MGAPFKAILYNSTDYTVLETMDLSAQFIWLGWSHAGWNLLWWGKQTLHMFRFIIYTKSTNTS